MIAFIVLAGFPRRVLFIAVPAVAIISYLNLRLIVFCPNYGRTINNQAMSFQRVEFCPYCGSKLESG